MIGHDRRLAVYYDARVLDHGTREGFL